MILSTVYAPTVLDIYPLFPPVSIDNRSSWALPLISTRATLVATSGTLPLHVQTPPVPTMSWEAAEAIVMQVSDPFEQLVWSTLAAPYRQRKHPALSRMGQASENDSEVPAKLFGTDLAVMLDSGFVSIHEDDVDVWVRIFTVVEDEKGRRRIIAWPRYSNIVERIIYDDLKRSLQRRVPFAYTARSRNAVKHKFAASADFTKFFQQFKVRSHYCFKYNGVTYRLTTVPTGAVGPPVLAEILTRALAAVSIRAVRADFSPNLVCSDTMIDNIRFTSNNLAVLTQVWLKFLDV